MIPAGQVQMLTGLSANQLREWTHRRALVLPDIGAQGSGHPALYSWQTVLLLRVAVVLRQRFRIELEAHRPLLHALRGLFAGTSFPTLRGHVLSLRAMQTGELLLRKDVRLVAGDLDVLFIDLDPHLDVLEAQFSPQGQSGQFPLFRAVSVR